MTATTATTDDLTTEVTAWLEANSGLIRIGRPDEVDHANLADYFPTWRNATVAKVASVE